MIDRHLAWVGQLKRQSEQPPGRVEHPLTQMLQLQVGLDLALVEVVPRLADFLGVEAVVPGLYAVCRSLGVGDGLHVGHLLVDPVHGTLPDRLHQL